MNNHPFGKSILGSMTALGSAVVMAGMLWWLFIFYGGCPEREAAEISVAYTAMLSIAGYYYWYVTRYMGGKFRRILAVIAVQIACIAVTSGIAEAFPEYSSEDFIRVLPLAAIIGTLCWIIMGMYYMSLAEKSSENEESHTIESEVVKTVAVPAALHLQPVSKISVKDTSGIVVLNPDDVIYIEADGDYAYLHTENKRYVKEETMKNLETILPSAFVRVHRSYIVNSEQIARVELLGKETYRLHLKNGVTIRASSSGYKLLRQKLSI